MSHLSSVSRRNSGLSFSDISWPGMKATLEKKSHSLCSGDKHENVTISWLHGDPVIAEPSVGVLGGETLKIIPLTSMTWWSSSLQTGVTHFIPPQLPGNKIRNQTQDSLLNILMSNL